MHGCVVTCLTQKKDGTSFLNITVFICGDFNTVVDPNIDRVGCNPNSAWAYNWSPTLQNIMSTFNLCDIWREKYPQKKEFSWHRKNGTQASRLDMIWLPKNQLDRVKTIDIFPFFRSDHSYVYLEFEPPKGIERGKGLWKFNNSHLKNPEFRNIVTSFWNDWCSMKPVFSSPSTWWEAGKTRLKILIKRFSRQEASDRRRHKRFITYAMKHAQRRVDAGENLQNYLILKMK